MKLKRESVHVVYFFFKGELDGDLHVHGERTEEEMEQFLDRHSGAIEVFEVRQEVRPIDEHGYVVCNKTLLEYLEGKENEHEHNVQQNDCP